MKKILTILLFSMLVSACSVNSSPQVPYLSHDELLGEWKLVRSSGGISGNITEYGEDDERYVIEFRESDFLSSKNGKELKRAKYEIVLGESIRSTEEIPLIVYETGEKQSFEFRNANLILFDECHDCFQNEYMRL